MAVNYQNKVQSSDKHLANLTTARNVHLDGSQAQVIVRTSAGRLLRVVICTKGIAFIVRDGSRVLGSFAATSPENTYDFGEYCNTNITVDVSSGSGSVNIAYND